MTTAKRLFLFLILCTLLSFGNIFCADVYPGDTVFNIPSIQAGFTTLLSADGGIGGYVESDFFIRGLFLDMLSLGISGEYRFHSLAGHTSILAGFGIGGGYTVNLPASVSVIPGMGLNLIFPITPDLSIFSELKLGCKVNLHLYDRSKLYLEGSFRFPFSDSQPALFSIGLGVTESKPVMIPLANVNPVLELSTNLFSPDNDGINDILEIKLKTEAPSSIEAWSLNIFDKDKNSVIFREGDDQPMQVFSWDGFSDNGTFVSSADDLTIEYIIIDKIGRAFILSEEIVVDVLILSEDGKFKINIPNIIFPPQSADFSALTDIDDIKKNQQILTRLSVIFNRFHDYNIRIEGHANSEQWQTADAFTSEQTNELIPLSLSRAEKIKESLVQLGIDERRITIEGLGASLPIVPFDDALNSWKNRRVEFVLVK